jgi:hypothetical protein
VARGVCRRLRGRFPSRDIWLRPPSTASASPPLSSPRAIPAGFELALFCCRKLGRKRPVKNSARPNYDDMNELFWEPDMLNVTYHNCDPEAGLGTLTRIPKTFREKSSYMAVAMSFWR